MSVEASIRYNKDEDVVGGLKMSKLELLSVYLNERLTAAVVEILGAVEKTFAEYQEENHRLRKILQITPEVQLSTIDSMQFSLSVCEDEVPPEQQHCEQEWSPRLGQELEPIQIKEEQEDLRTSQEEEQLQCLDADNIEFRFPSSCVKSECDQEDSVRYWISAQTQTVGNRETEAKPVDITPLISVAHIKKEDTACDLPDNQIIDANHTSVVSNNPVGLDSRSLLDPHPSVEECSETNTMYGKPRRRRELLAWKVDLNGHVTLAQKRSSKCSLGQPSFNSSCKLKTQVRLCSVEQPICSWCHKTFKSKNHLERHILTHTGERPFICADCGKSFNRKDTLKSHIQIHTRKQPSRCGDYGKTFTQTSTLGKQTDSH